MAVTALLLTGVLTLLGVPAKDSAGPLTETVYLFFLGLSLSALYRIFDLDDYLSVYDFPDLRLAHSLGAAKNGVILASRFTAWPLIIETGTYMLTILSVAAAAVLSGVTSVVVSATATGGALLLCVKSLTRLVKVFVAKSLLLLPSRYIGVGFIGISAIGPLALGVLLIAAAPWVLRIIEKISDGNTIMPLIIDELLAIAMINTLITALSGAATTFWFLPLLLTMTVAATGISPWVAPRDDYRTQLKLKQPAKWRNNVDFARKPLLSSIDKDARLIVRRGYAAWKQLGILVSLTPTIAILAIMAQALTSSASEEFIARHFMTTTLIICSIIASLSFMSMFIGALLSVELDGTIIRFIRNQRMIRTFFCALRFKVQCPSWWVPGFSAS